MYIPANKCKQINNFDSKDVALLSQIGINLDSLIAQKSGVGMDALTATFTTPNVGAPIQFLQNWLPGIVSSITAARKIDELVGITNAGAWEDEEIVQVVLEKTGYAQPYGDYTDTPLSNYNTNFEKRTVVRYEEGLSVNKLEEMQQAKFGVDMADWKRKSVIDNLEISRNSVGFVGFNNGNNKTYGLLNDPNLPAYVNVVQGASAKTDWASKTALEIQQDIVTAMTALQTQSGSNFDPNNDPCVLGIADSCIGYLDKTTQWNMQTVRQFILNNYKGVRIVAVPEMNKANGDANVFYLFAEGLKGDSTDNGRTFDQIVPTKLLSLGNEVMLKGFTEGYSNATAGVFCKRPYLVKRYSGI